MPLLISILRWLTAAAVSLGYLGLGSLGFGVICTLAKTESWLRELPCSVLIALWCFTDVLFVVFDGAGDGVLSLCLGWRSDSSGP